MRWILALAACVLSLAFAAYHLQKAGEGVERRTAALRAQALLDEEGLDARYEELALAARERAVLYEEMIEAQQLENGMVVSRRDDGRADAVCDSLLFSSLRYTALVKLGWHDKAERAWRAIVGAAYQNGRWVRHPQCRKKVTSRDMIFGLVTALSQDPPEAATHLAQLLRIIDETDGSVDPGPFYVSRLSPGLGELIKQMSLAHGWKQGALPGEVRIAFSTLELDTWLGSPGFVSHLSGLMLWNELELLQRQREVRSLTQLIAGVWPLDLAQLRLQWAGQKLAETDPENLFFVWLKFRSAGALSQRVKVELLGRLLSLPAFPEDRLPQNCDRRADYLWQRGSVEYKPLPGEACHETFPGIDFLWMVALLTGEFS